MGSWRTNLKPPSCRPRSRVHSTNSAGVSARRNDRARSARCCSLPRNAAILLPDRLAPHPGPLPASGARETTHREVLTFLRRTAISLGAGAAHQHRPLGVAQPVALQEGLDGLLVIDDGERARPVRAPQAAIETPGIEHAGERVPNVGKGYGSLDSVQAP